MALAHVERITQREYEALAAFVRDFNIAAHKPDTAAALESISVAETRHGDLPLWRAIQYELEPFIRYHETYPFLVAPPGTVDQGDFSLHAHQRADGQLIKLAKRRVAEHVGIFGRSGAGKTTFAHHLADEAYAHSLSVLTIETKDDARHFPLRYPQTIVITPRTPIPLLDVPPWLTRAEANNLLVRTMKRTWWGGEGLEQVGHESLRRTYEKYPHPALADWHRETRSLHEKGATYNRRDRIDALLSKQARLSDLYPGIGTTPAGSGIALDDLCARPVYFGYTVQTSAEDFIANWLVELRFAYNRAHAIRTLNTIALFDESLLLFHEDTITGSASLANTFPLLREFGIGVVLTANHYAALPAAVRANLGTHIVMNLSDASDTRELATTIDLTTPGREHLITQMAQGDCLVRLPDGWQHAMLATFPPHTIAKNISRNDWDAAEARTLALARERAPVTLDRVQLFHDDAAKEANRAERQATTSSSRPSAATAHLALNAHAEALLHDAAEHPLTLTTPAYDRCGLHWMQGDRAKAYLIRLGLLESHRIRVGGGRGKTGSALRVTSLGWKRLDRTPPKGTRGGGVQHEWLARTIATALRGNLELLGADVLVRVDGERHAKLFTALNTTLPDGALVAIQVECSDPAKTIPPNASRDSQQGVDLSVFAVLPEALPAARRCIERLPQRGRVVLVNALQFVEALQ